MSDNQIFGIDLGTTYSCIAYVDEHGKPVVIANTDNQLTTPSVVYFESEDNIVVGSGAKDVAELYPTQVVSTVKRVMGDDDWVFEYAGHSYTPQEISSHILRKVVADAEANTGKTIKDVVITVPAYFGLNQKEVTKQAGILAGLNVHYVIPEPTAAAIAYGMEQEENQVVLIYDLGGGTFDVTVIEIKEKAITVICTGGDHKLGGRDWDEALALYFAQCFSDGTGIAAEDLTNDLATWQELLNIAEKCKLNLTSRESIPQKISYEGDRVVVDITREKFEEITSSFLEQTLSLTEKLLDTAKDKGYTKIDQLLLVGGSTYMPQIQKALEKKFSFDTRLFDPNQSVAKGAAIFGYKYHLDEQIKISIAEETGQTAETVDLDKISEDDLNSAQEKVAQAHGMALPNLKKLVEKEITNVTSKSFGIVITTEKEEERVQNLIVVDDVVPVNVTESFATYADNQEGVQLRCIENVERIGLENTITLDPEQQLGEAELRFTKVLPKDSPIEVTFSLAADGLLSIYAKDLTTNQEIDVEFKTHSILSVDELEEKIEHNLNINVSS